MGDVMSFGEIIAKTRKDKGLSQRQLASLIKKEDGQAISAPYLNDIEHDRRSPSSDHIIEQFAAALQIESDLLYFAIRRIPPQAYVTPIGEKRIIAAFRALRREVEQAEAIT